MLTFAVYLQDHPGALNRVASLFRRRALNIASLTVGHTEHSGISRMTIVVDAPETARSRIEANLYKLLDVERVESIAEDAVDRDLAMIKVVASGTSRGDIMQLVDVFRARVIDVAPDSLIVEITGTEDKIDGLLDVLRPYGVLEMVRTGRVSMSRGGQELKAARRRSRLDAAVAPTGLAQSV
ncbi:MAG: acetolactate synthase small subunit [Planctomycetota bacterium]|nr:acetolactate synthase small subunit [Planctomycetota bacterium]